MLLRLFAEDCFFFQSNYFLACFSLSLSLSFLSLSRSLGSDFVFVSVVLGGYNDDEIKAVQKGKSRQKMTK